MKTRIEQIKQTLAPRSIVRVCEGEYQRTAYLNGFWQETSAEAAPSRGLFGYEIFLIPRALTLFRLREFPVEHVPEADIAEAVRLDLESWSPWAESGCYYWLVRDAGKWLVSVWAWQQTSVEQLLEDASNLAPTHIMPEEAFDCAALEQDGRECVYIRQEDDALLYIHLHHTGLPLQHMLVSSEAESRRFYAAEAGREIPVLLAQGVEPWLAGNVSEQASFGLPNSAALRTARQSGVEDFTDPLSWLRPVATCLGIYLFWLLGSGLILWGESRSVAEEVSAAKGSALKVVDQRERVKTAYDLLAVIYQAKDRQPMLARVLAALSDALPDDAWLLGASYEERDGGWLDITGRSKDSIQLVALLEKLPAVEHAVFLQDVRRDRATGLEPFKIRLKLAAIEELGDES